MKTAVLSISYIGSIDWWAALVQQGSVVIEAHENYQKQSYRNRCYIDSPNGILPLNIPVRHKGKKRIAEVEISYQENWAAKHIQAIQTTYRNSPFYDTIAPSIFEILHEKPTSLWDLNLLLFKEIAQWLRLETKVDFTKHWDELPKNQLDLRQSFDPKQPSLVKHFPPYTQAFDHKHGFIKNLCILDLLFNEGPAAYDYLKEVEFVFSRTS